VKLVESHDLSVPAIASQHSAAASGTAAKSPFPEAASVPTQIGPAGIRYDFNAGCRVFLPERESGSWRLQLTDMVSRNLIYRAETKGGTFGSLKQWFVPFRIEVWSLDEGGAAELVFFHEYDSAHRHILIQFPVGTLGDVMAWFPYAARFAEKFPQAQVSCALSGLIIPVLEKAYPNLRLLTHEQVAKERVAEKAYATYSLGLFFDDADCNRQPADFRLVGLHRTAAHILGVDPAEQAPHLVLPDESRPIAEPYVCIAVQSSSGCKYWTNPYGWRDVVAALKAAGYRVICIDQKFVHGSERMWTSIPNGAEDETGDRPLAERARWLRHADFFIGLSSGLAWLAWAAGCKTVMISGFTHPMNEFTNPYRVINWHACNSCWNDTNIRFNHGDFFWCPRHAGTARHFECTRSITPEHVMDVIKTIPEYQNLTASNAAAPGQGV
jgi:autotransporter strand-loop-strand O-heptosyltransferase